MPRSGFVVATSPRVVRWLGAITLGVAVVGCSRRALSVVLDLPAPRPAAATATVDPRAAAESLRLAGLPQIETVRNVDSVIALLPRDHAGNVDWVAAVRDSVIVPRSAPQGSPARPPVSAENVGFDVEYPAGDSLFTATFPHGEHATLMECRACHPRPAKVNAEGARLVMAAKATDCGKCHATVAFPAANACERCHQKLTQLPANRHRAVLDQAPPIRLRSFLPDSVRNRDTMARSYFSHGTHRIRYQCRACHSSLFPIQAGGATISMTAIAAGKQCGSCHNDRAAFGAGYQNCARCHAGAPATRVAAREGEAP